MICRYGRHGKETTGRHCAEPPPALRYQRYQFGLIGGHFRKRSYRSGLRTNPPRNLKECDGLIWKLARRMHFQNGSVEVEDLVQIGQTVLWEGLENLRARAVRLRPPALKVLLESAQAAMFHALDRQLVSLESLSAPDGDEGADRWEDTVQDLPGAECNRTVFRQGLEWNFVPNCCESWGAPLPPGSCQPRPGSLCALPWHLPLAGE